VEYRKRDRALDVVRGICIVSMVIRHMSYGSFLDTGIHAPFWIDGAFGFVFLSGLVLGMMQRSATERTGQPNYRRLIDRAELLFIISFGLLTLALIVERAVESNSGLPQASAFAGWWNSLWLAATLQLPARYLDILPMYVVLLIASTGAFALLRHAKVTALALLSCAVYLLALQWPSLTVLPALQESKAGFNWGAWQFPFVIAAIVGWNWEQWRLRDTLLTKTTLYISAGTFVTLSVLAQLLGRFNLTPRAPMRAWASDWFDKYNIGPGRIIFGVAAMILAYWMTTWLIDRQFLTPVVSFLQTLGARSLDSFVILCLAVIIIPAVAPYSRGGVWGNFVSLIVITLCWAWARFRASTRWPTRSGLGDGNDTTLAGADSRTTRQRQ
jgi:hypothetical protein